MSDNAPVTAPTISFERGLTLNLLSVLLNSIATTISKFALKSINPILTTLMICLTSTLLSLGYIFIRKHKLSAPEFRRLLPIAVINGIATVLLYSSIAILDPVTVGMIGRFYVVFTTLLSVLILKEKLSGSELVLIFIAILGTFLFVQGGSGPSMEHYIGVAMALSYTFLFALANLFVKKNVHNASSVTILFYNNLFATAACMVALLVQQVPVNTMTAIDAMSVWYSVLTAVITFSGLVLFFNSFRFLSFKLSNLIRSASPLFVALVSWPFFPIKLGLGNTSGGAMVLFSIVFLSFIEKRKK
jgi:drug/metabolite transporter (DMT)-like permease